jgi:hypothetical protein
MSSWLSLAEGLVPSIPAVSAFEAEYSSPALNSALAAAGYRFKNGESVWLSAPFLSPNDLGLVIRYLHQIRLESLRGQQRANWFNGPNMKSLSDLLVWTRASGQHSLLRKDPQLAVQWVRSNPRSGELKQALHKPGRILRTLLCQQSVNMTSLCEALAQQANPFAVLVDMTPFGVRDNPKELFEHLSVFFPNTPILVLSTIGDRSSDSSLLELQLPFQFWRQHLLDPTFLAPSYNPKHSTVLTLIPDFRLDTSLMVVLNQCRTLKDCLEHRIELQSKIIPPLYRIINAMRSLVIPMTFYESYMDKHRRGGMFPVRPLKEWLQVVRLISLPTGESEQCRDIVVDELEDILISLNDGSTGKSQALNQWLQEYLNGDNDCLILTGSEREANLLYSWLSKGFLTDLSIGKLTIVGSGSVRDTYKKLSKEFDQVLIVGALWESEYWVLSLGNRIHWLAYPNELHWQRKISRDAEVSNVPSLTQKADLWELGSTKPLSLPLGSVDVCEVEWTSCRGQYAHYNDISCDLPTDPNWLEALMADIESPVSSKVSNEPEPGDVSILTLEGGHYRFSDQQKLYILRGLLGKETLDQVIANDLLEGDYLVQLTGNEGECFALMDTLIEYAIDNTTEHKVFRDQALLWFMFIDHAVHACGGVSKLHQQLLSANIKIGIDSVRRWHRHIGIGPKNKLVVPTIAKLSKVIYTNQTITAVTNAQSKVRGLHSAMGRLLRKLAYASKAGNTTAAGSGGELLNQALLVDLVCVEEITVVRKYDPIPVYIESPDNLASILSDKVNKSHGKLVATTAALKSAQDSPFQDFARVKRCLDILRDYYFRVYGDKSILLTRAIDAGAAHRIEFRGDTAATTKGLYPTYQRRHNGNSVDIGKHLCIGSSRSPERCFRLHFHWDNNQKQIVIHHAGRHLPTS